MDEEMERFQNQLRLQITILAVKDTQSALATDTGKLTLKDKNQERKKIKSKDKNKSTNEIPLCICGHKMWYAYCSYLVSSKPPAG